MIFLRTIATHRLTLFLAGFFALTVWLLHAFYTGNVNISNLKGIADFAGGLFLCSLTVYLTAELNNAFALLRISSRMISSTLALLLAPAVFLHPLQDGHAVMVFAVAVLFPLFASYKNNQVPVLSLLIFLFLSLASLFYPRLLYTVPLLWISQSIMRSLSLRHLMAGIIGLCIPYWFFLAAAFCNDSMSLLTWHLNQLIQLPEMTYESLELQQWLMTGLLLIMFITGTTHCLLNANADNTRTRQNYIMVIMLGTCSFIMLALLPADFNTLFPLCLIPTAIVSGHFFALSTGKAQHIIAIVIAVMIFALTAYAI